MWYKFIYPKCGVKKSHYFWLINWAGHFEDFCEETLFFATERFLIVHMLFRVNPERYENSKQAD